MSQTLRRKLTAGVIVRSLALNLAFYVSYPVIMIAGFFFLLTPRPASMWALRQWSRFFLFICRRLGGLGFEVRGREFIPSGGAIVAGKHQSMWETFALFHLMSDPAIVLKKELTYIPLVGWFLLKFRMIPVEREAGARALKELIRRAREAIAQGRQILIFPEGTRRPVGAAPEYKSGVAALYGGLEAPCVPFALNSGVFWPRRSFWRWPGTIVVEFLPPIPPGLPRREFMKRLEAAIEPVAEELAESGIAELTARMDG